MDDNWISGKWVMREAPGGAFDDLPEKGVSIDYRIAPPGDTDADLYLVLTSERVSASAAIVFEEDMFPRVRRFDCDEDARDPEEVRRVLLRFADALLEELDRRRRAARPPAPRPAAERFAPDFPVWVREGPGRPESGGQPA